MRNKITVCLNAFGDFLFGAEFSIREILMTMRDKVQIVLKEYIRYWKEMREYGIVCPGAI